MGSQDERALKVAPAAMEFRVLGSLEVLRDGSPLGLGRGRQRSLLALLLLERNRAVSADRLIDELWGDDPPRTARTALQGHVAQLRKLLGHARLVTRGPGYVLRVDDGELDADRFERLLGEGRVEEALALWRGSALADLHEEPFAQPEIGRLEGLRLAAWERRLADELDNGQTANAVTELEALVCEHPFRERLWSLLMLALYRAGRQVDALAAFRAARRVLLEEQGIEPSDELKVLHGRILAQDSSLAAPARTGREMTRRRKTVSVLYCGLVEAVALGERLDPEALAIVLDRFHEACRDALVRHGGSLVESSGGKVVGEFGLARAHEDDALRSLRAASELSEALASLELASRIGVATGEVVAYGGTSTLVGSALGLAALLGAGASPDEVVFDGETYRRCRNAVAARALAHGLDGSEEREAYLLEGLVAGAPPFKRSFETPLVGRERELAELRSAFDGSVEQRTTSAVTLLGAPGIGKTRLVGELLSSLGGRSRVLLGHCLPYGDDVALAPLREAVADAFGVERPAEAIARALAGEPDAATVAAHVVTGLGLEEGASTREDTFWALRRLLEGLAARSPVVLVLEDVHWGDDTLLDLLEYLADYVRDAPLLVVSVARPELAETHPDRLSQAVRISLAPLSAGESRALVDHLSHDASPELRARIADAAEGNPLFVEQMLAHALEEGGELETPATIQALLAARADGLGAAERAALEAAAVVGVEFSSEALEALLPASEHAALESRLAALVRLDFVRPAPTARLPGGLRFSHALVRDAAYAAIAKLARAEMHERLASWLEARSDEQYEVVGYHFEQAHRALAELGETGERARGLGGRAAVALGAAGERAIRRGDFVGAFGVLSRASVLATDERQRLDVIFALGNAHRHLRRFVEAAEAFAEAAGLARALGERDQAVRAELMRGVCRGLEPTFDLRALERSGRAAARRFEAAGDMRGAYEAWFVTHIACYYGGAHGRALSALERAIPLGRASEALETRIVSRPLVMHLYGPTPSSTALAFCEELRDSGLGAAGRADAFSYGGVLLAMRGEPDRGREWVARATELWREAGADPGGWWGESAWVEMLAGDWAAAERDLGAQCALLDAPGRERLFATYAALLAHVLFELGRDAEALEWSEVSEARAPELGIAMQADWRGARAKALARAGANAEAEALARRGVELAGSTDSLWLRGNAALDLAGVLALAGRDEEARGAAGEALAWFERKEHLVGVERATAVLATLDA